MRASAEPRIGGATHVVGIVGWPVEHSLSPAIHNAAFEASGLDWTYVPLPVPPRALAEALAGLAALGFRGANVTMPHKTETADLVGDLSEDARLLRAVNTIVVRDGELEGHNTDAPGFDRFLRRDAGFDPSGATALIYGAGGAARACALALARAGIAGLTVAARDEARAAPLVSIVEGVGVPIAVVGPGAVGGLSARSRRQRDTGRRPDAEAVAPAACPVSAPASSSWTSCTTRPRRTSSDAPVRPGRPRSVGSAISWSRPRCPSSCGPGRRRRSRRCRPPPSPSSRLDSARGFKRRGRPVDASEQG